MDRLPNNTIIISNLDGSQGIILDSKPYPCGKMYYLIRFDNGALLWQTEDLFSVRDH